MGSIDDQLARLGHVRLEGIASRHVRPVRASLLGRRDGAADRVLDAWRTDDDVRRLATDRAILGVLGELVGRRPIPFQTLNFSRGTEQRLHADTIHFDSLPSGLMCAVWVALEDVGAEQGPVRYVPRSHLLPTIRPSDVPTPSDGFDYERYEDLVEARVSGMPVEEFHAAAGDVLVWAANLAHGGAPVLRTGSSRWSQVTHYFFEGACYITPMHSRFDREEYFVRHPLTDISTGKAAIHTIDGRRAAMVHLPGGRSRLVGPDDPAPALLDRARSGARGTVRQLKWRAGSTSASIRRRTSARGRGRS